MVVGRRVSKKEIAQPERGAMTASASSRVAASAEPSSALPLPGSSAGRAGCFSFPATRVCRSRTTKGRPVSRERFPGAAGGSEVGGTLEGIRTNGRCGAGGGDLATPRDRSPQRLVQPRGRSMRICPSRAVLSRRGSASSRSAATPTRLLERVRRSDDAERALRALGMHVRRGHYVREANPDC